MSKLGKKIFIIFLVLVIFSLLFVGVFINFSIGEKFDDFINLQREENIDELAEMIIENYQNNNFNSIRSLVENFSRTNKIPIWIEDSKGEFIYFPFQSSQMSKMMRRMHNNTRMNHMNMMHQVPQDFPGQDKTKEIYNKGEKILTLHWKKAGGENQLDSELYNYFKNNVYRAIALSALLVTFLVVILSFFLSKKITSPIIEVKNAALEVAGGNYQQNIKSKGDDELTELIEAFNRMSRKLLKLEKIRKESTSDLAHELRTPLTTIKGYLEAIEDGKLKADKETIKEMQEESQRMNILIEKLNEFANAQNKIFNLNEEFLNLTPIIKKIIKQHYNYIEQKKIDIQLDLEPELYLKADKDSLFQIFNNIIENAIKYNVVNGEIEIKNIKKDDHLVIQIKDSGVGINKKDLPYIFERFYRADKSRNSKNQGTGIGLAVVKELMDVHQGKIRVKSSESETIFELIFPKA